MKVLHLWTFKTPIINNKIDIKYFYYEYVVKIYYG